MSENRGYPEMAVLKGNMIIIHWNCGVPQFQTNLYPIQKLRQLQQQIAVLELLKALTGLSPLCAQDLEVTLSFHRMPI